LALEPEFDLGAIKKQFGFDDEGIHISEKPEAIYIPLSMAQPKTADSTTSGM